MGDKMRAPTGLGKAGRALWGRLTGTYDFDPGELAILETACRQADMNAALEELLAAEGLSVVGSAGQQRLHAGAAELRQGRLALGRLIGMLALPDEGDRPMTDAAKRAQRAAQARWEQVEAQGVRSRRRDGSA